MLLTEDEFNRISMALRGERPPLLRRLRRPPLAPVLTEDQVCKIRRSPEGHRTLAARYGVSRKTISDIKSWVTWLWLPD